MDSTSYHSPNKLHIYTKNGNETLTDDSGNSCSRHTGKDKILKFHYEKLGSELDMESFDESWKEKVSS